MNQKAFILSLCFLLCTIPVTAVGTSGVPYSFYKVPACSGNILIKVTEYTNTSYQLPTCSQKDDVNWVCPCKDELQVSTPENTTSHFTFRIQYYIAPTKEPGLRSDPNLPTANELYNENLERIVTVTDVILLPATGASEEEVIQPGDFIFFIFMLILVILLLLLGGAAVIYAKSETISRWFGWGEDKVDKTTAKKIFQRPDIERKSIGKPQATSSTSTYEDEARKILEDL